jgi:NAD(P)-dependent dehydrogenase (short-subunit alcohol dehydrogenase family)
MKSIIITGATSGIGYECAIQIAKLAINEQIILACRNLKTGNKTIETIKHKTGHKNIICLPLDLESLESIREFKKQFEKTGTKISTLINNAGLQNVDKTKYTKDGIEQTFGVNHLAPFYLTLLLIPYLAEDASITFTASGTHDPDQKSGMPAPEFKEAKLLAYPVETDETKIKVGQRRYATSKLCNILTTYELQKRLANTKIRVNAFDPGLVPGTGLARNYPPVLKFISDYVFKALIVFVHNVNTAQNSGKRLANLAYSDKYKSAKGKYFEGEKEIKSSTDSYNKELQKNLWESSIELLGVTQNETSISLT